MLSSCHTKVLVLISVISGEVLFNHSWRSTCATSAGQICVPSQLSGNGAITLARMSFHLFSVYESGVTLKTGRMSLRMCFPQSIFPQAFRTFSAYSDVRPNALRTARITGIFQTHSI